MDEKYKEKDKNGEIKLSDLLNVYHDGYEVNYMFNKSDNYFKNLSDIGIYRRGTYDIDTKQYKISVKINKNFSNDQLSKLEYYILNALLPEIKESIIENNENYKGKILDIFEHNLCLDGIYSILINNNKFKIVLCRYYKLYDVFEHDSLFEVLSYIRSQLYYE